jgi:hypothetical protein
MSIIFTRHPNRHQPEPVRGAVVLPCKKPLGCAPSQRKVMGIHFGTGHLSHVIARQTGLVDISIGRAITQIPIDRHLR